MNGANLWIDGHPAKADDLAHQALVNYGAYTSFAVTDGGVRGLDRHLARLREAAVELFGQAVPQDQARAWMRQALGDRRDAWMRVSLFAPQIGVRSPDWIGCPQVMVGVFDPVSPLSATPLRLQPQTYGREAPHLKHAATFGLIRARRAARAAGFDDALFVDDAGRIAEASVSNIGFLAGDRVIWPEGPMLAGVSQALISSALNTETRPVTLADLRDFDGAFVTNSATPACAVAAIGDHAFATTADRIARVIAAWTAAPLQSF